MQLDKLKFLGQAFTAGWMMLVLACLTGCVTAMQVANKVDQSNRARQGQSLLKAHLA